MKEGGSFAVVHVFSNVQNCDIGLHNVFETRHCGNGVERQGSLIVQGASQVIRRCRAASIVSSQHERVDDLTVWCGRKKAQSRIVPQLKYSSMSIAIHLPNVIVGVAHDSDQNAGRS